MIHAYLSTKPIAMIHAYQPNKLHIYGPFIPANQLHIYDSCIPTNYESIARPGQKIKARLALCSQSNNGQCLLPLPCLLAVTNDRIEAGFIKLQPVLLHLIAQLQHHLPLTSLLACITALKLIALGSNLCCCITSSSCAPSMSNILSQSFTSIIDQFTVHSTIYQ